MIFTFLLILIVLALLVYLTGIGHIALPFLLAGVVILLIIEIVRRLK